ncbi:MAG: hypothetical protein RLZZ543_1776 [Bacteroidota bacterium]|jgi:NAD(P)H-dependent FMN reductase
MFIRGEFIGPIYTNDSFMTTLISATNRLNSSTLKVTNAYARLMQEKGMEINVVNIEDIPVETVTDAIYRKGENSMRTYGHQIFNSADRFVVIVPEYNGSIPGILKLLIDCCDPTIFKGKKFALVGVASGRAGNLRGMDHLTDVFHYLQAEVYSLKLPVSQVFQLMNEEREVADPATLEVLSKQIDGFTKF